MQNWSSAAEIAAEFGFDKHASDTENLRSEIKKLVAALHPDRNGGSFPSESEKNKFLRAKSAMDFLDRHSQSSMTMIPISQLPAVVSAVAQALALSNPSEANTLQTSYLTDARETISRQFILPKISSGVFATITGLLISFPDKFEKHPLLGPLLEGVLAQKILLILLVYSAFTFALVWYKERVAESHAEYLMSESALEQIFKLLIHTFLEEKNVGRVSFYQILEAVKLVAGQHNNAQFSLLSPFVRTHLDLATIEKAAAIQTQRLVERKVLSKIDVSSLHTWYEISADARTSTSDHSSQRTFYTSL